MTATSTGDRAVSGDGYAAGAGNMAGTLRLARSKFGRILTAVRDAENRLMFCGYDPKGFKLLVWTLSGCTVRRRALYVPQVGIINPSEMSPTNSVEAAIWSFSADVEP